MRTILLLAFSAVLALAQDKAAQIDRILSQYHDYRQFNGSALVSEGGKVIFKKGFGLANMEWDIPNTPDTRFRLGSITKQFTAVVILQLVNEGKLRLEDKMSQYVPDYPKKTADRVTIHQLLNHTSGIPSYTSIPKFMADKVRDPYTPIAFVKTFSDMDLEFDPGSKFRYNNSGYFLLGVIIEKVTGKTYEDALQERIFGPLGMSGTGYDLHTPILSKRASGYHATAEGFENAPYLDMTIPYAAGSLYSTVEDLYVWDQALYSDKVLPAKSRDLMFTPHLDNYGYGWVIRKVKAPGTEREVTTIGHGGGIFGFNTLFERIVDDRHMVVLLNNTGGTKLGEMVTSIRNVLYGAEVKPPKKPVARELYSLIQAKDVQAAVQQCREWRADAAANYDVNAGELAMLSNHLVKQKRFSDAEEIAKLNVELHPKVFFAHFSLGEVYREAGKRDEAVKSYAKALELNPGDRGPVAQRLKEMLDK